ncbi:MAG: polysaccharide deacetylase family protein, partial [Bdellovibrio sp.]
MVKKSILLTGALFLSACSNKVGTSIQESVINNQKAASQKQWVESGRHPEALFSDWRSEYASGDTKAQSELAELVCSELLQLDELSLTLFEEELNKKENEVIVNACQAELLDRIERYFVRQRKSMRVPLQTVQQRASFTFGKNIQTRDLSNGYYAINGDLKPKEVILTFDDGPVANYTQSIVNSLDQVNAKAIFFHLGKNVRLNPDLVKRLAKSGHTVG